MVLKERQITPLQKTKETPLIIKWPTQILTQSRAVRVIGRKIWVRISIWDRRRDKIGNFISPITKRVIFSFPTLRRGTYVKNQKKKAIKNKERETLLMKFWGKITNNPPKFVRIIPKKRKAIRGVNLNLLVSTIRIFLITVSQTKEIREDEE